VIMNIRRQPVALILARQPSPTLDRSRYASAAGVEKGAYVLAEVQKDNPDVLVIATGSEVALAVDAFEHLKTEGVRARVISMPSWELFEQQSQAYRDSVIPPSVKARVVIEQASTFGWERYAGTSGTILGMKTFGASAPLKVLQKEFGFTVENIVAAAKNQIRAQQA
jgi:transketolase